MKHKLKKPMAFMMALAMILSLFAALPITASADAAPSLTMQVMGKDGTTVAWSNTWYYQAGTSTNSYLDATLTKNSDGTGGELSILHTFDDAYFAANTKYSYFDQYNAFVYVGGRKGPTARIGVVKRGILMDDLVKYAETQSGFSTLDGETKVQMTAASDGKVWPYTDIENCAFEDYYWGQTRYYFKGMAEAIPTSGGYGTWFTSNAMELMTDENRVEVPYVFAMVGYGGDCKSLEYALNTADTMMSLRTYMGTSTLNKTAYDGGDTDFQGNLGNPSAQNIGKIDFYPVYNAITVNNGTASGTEGQSGYSYDVTNATVTTSDNWFKAAEGELASMTVTPDDGYTISSVDVAEATSGDAVETVRSGNAYTFAMPDDAVTVTVTANDLGNSTTNTVTLPSTLDGIWTMTATSVGGTDAAVGTPGTAPDGQTVTLTVTRDENALTSSIGGITVKDSNDQTVEVTPVSSTSGDYDTVKEAAYSFVMPSSNVTVSLTENYASMKIFEQAYPTAETIEKKTFTRDQLSAMDEPDDFYYGGFDSEPAAIEGRGTVSVALTDLLENAGVEFLPGDSFTVTSVDGSQTTLTYSELYSAGRYYFPALYTGDSWAAKSNGKILCQPHLIITGTQAQNADFGDSESIATAACDSANACQLAFGLTMDEFSVNADASPSADCLTATGFVTHITAITVNHAYSYDVTWYVGHEGDNSYTITTEEELRGLAAIVNGTAVDAEYNSVAQTDFSGKTITLGADIAFTSKWTPIGNAAYSFAGTFDGAGKNIIGLTITDAVGGYKGLFGNNSGTVKNFTIKGAIGTEASPVTSGSDNIGGAVGYNSGMVTGVTSQVSIYVKTSAIYAVGGIVGQNGVGGTIAQCANYADITGTKCTGGIVGRSFGSVTKCYNSGDIQGNGGGKDSIGGIAGQCGDKSSTYTNSVVSSYNCGTISNPSGRWYGGIAGMADSATAVTNCYNVGQIETGYSWNWNPVIGHVDSAYSTITNNYSLTGLNAGDSNASTLPNTTGTVKTAEEMRSSDFVTLLGSDYKTNSGCWPVLDWQTASGHVWDEGIVTLEPTATTTGTMIYTCTVCGETKSETMPALGGGSYGVDTSGLNLSSTTWDGITVDVSWYVGHESATSYTINTAAKLAGAAAIDNGLINENCKVYTGAEVLTAAVWNNTTYVNNASGTHGDCNRATDDYSYGVDDFNGKTLYLKQDLDMSAGNYMPLGGQYLMTSDDTNTKIGSSFCGVFEGGGHNVTIQCDRYCSGNYGDGESVGLIGRMGVHDNDPVSIRPVNPAVRNVAIYGEIYANRSVGGIVGKIGKTSATIDNKSSGDGSTGGIIENCANFASVTGTDAKGTGGICGASWNGGVIRNCYNAGTVFNSHNSYGGIAGSNEIALINCYNVGMVTGVGTSAAIATENGDSTYMNCYWLNISADMGVYNIVSDQVISKTSTEMQADDFLSVLGSAYVKDSGNINSGYPVLAWQVYGVTTDTSGSGKVTTSTAENTSTITIDVKATASGKTGSASVTSDTMSSAVTKALEGATATGTKAAVKINVETASTCTSLQTTIPSSALSSVATSGVSDLTISSDLGSVTLGSSVLSNVASQAGSSNVTVSIAQVETSTLTTEQQMTVGDGVVINLSITAGGSAITSFGGEEVSFSLPVTATVASGQTVSVYYLNSNNQLVLMEGTYNSSTGMVTFTTTHLSEYVLLVEKTWTNSFTDVASLSWYYDAVKYVSESGLFSGTSDTAFEPSTNMTRGMLVTVLWRLEGEPTAESAGFTDVQAGAWYCDAVNWAAANGIVSGYDAESFGANDVMSREQLAAILYRYAQLCGYDTTQGGMAIREYSDYEAIASWASEGMAWANASGLVTGTTGNTLSPTDSATRAQVATILMRFMQGIAL